MLETKNMLDVVYFSNYVHISIVGTFDMCLSSKNAHQIKEIMKNAKSETKYARCRLLFPPYLCN